MSSKRRKNIPAIPDTRQPVTKGTPLSVAIRQASSEHWQGPLPPPKSLKDFGEIDLSFPERIVRMAEAAAQHQRDMEAEAMRQQGEGIRADSTIKQRGQVFAAGLAVFFGLVGAWIAYLGHPGVAATIIGTTVVGLATVFVVGRSMNGDKGH